MNTEMSSTVLSFKIILGDYSCFYCGVKELCELPFDEETVERIDCPTSCLKFEG